MYNNRTIALTDREATLAAKGDLRAIVRKCKRQPEQGKYEWVCTALPGKPFRGFGDSVCSEAITNIRSELPNLVGQMNVNPFGAPGDVLHGKESFCYIDSDYGQCVAYKSDDEAQSDHWRSPVTMPREFIRRHFTVRTVRAMIVKDMPDWESWMCDNYKKASTRDWLWYAELEAI